MVAPARTQVGEWLNELFLIEQDVRLHLEPLPEAQFNARPRQNRWSVGECLDHLAITTTLMLEKVRPALERARAKGRMGGDGPYRYGWLGGWFVRTMETPGGKPLASPDNFVPASTLPKSAVLEKFSGAMQDFREALESAEGVALDRVKAGSSARGMGWIRLNLAAWLAAGLAHCRRHVAQAKRAGNPDS